MARQLVTVRTVAAVAPIEGADVIVRAVIDGWNVVVKKGEFQPGDQCVYFEIDSMLPMSDPRFAFLSARGVTTDDDGLAWHRLRTAKLRGVVSQGLALPVGDFPECDAACIADAFGVRKYDPPLPAGDAVGPFLSEYAAKTDAERVQNLTGEWETLRGVEWQASEKIDGTSCTVVWDVVEQRVRVCGRNWEIGDGDNVYWDAVRRYDLAGVAAKVAADAGAQQSVALQVEVYGPGVQANPLRVPERRVAWFGLWVDRRRVAVPEHPLCAPRLDVAFPATVEAAVVAADGLRSAASPGHAAEGIVWHTPTHDPVKAINNRYLLKHGG